MEGEQKLAFNHFGAFLFMEQLKLSSAYSGAIGCEYIEDKEGIRVCSQFKGEMSALHFMAATKEVK